MVWDMGREVWILTGRFDQILSKDHGLKNIIYGLGITCFQISYEKHWNWNSAGIRTLPTDRYDKIKADKWIIK